MCSVYEEDWEDFEVDEWFFEEQENEDGDQRCEVLMEKTDQSILAPVIFTFYLNDMKEGM